LGYYPFWALDKVREHQFVSYSAQKHLDPVCYLGTFQSFSKDRKHQFTTDDYFMDLMDRNGVDISALKAMYSLTPMSPESVYKDFAKYHIDYDYSSLDFDKLESGGRWYVEWVKKTTDRRPEVLDYDDVYIMLDKTKSATALFNQFFSNKNDLFESQDFLDSLVSFLYSYCLDQDCKFLFLAIQKEEIRPTDKIKDLKIRSIIVGSIYLLVIGHMLFGDLDDILIKNWFTYRSGIGMSFFDGDYHKKISELIDGDKSKFFFFSDIPKYDSTQMGYLHILQTRAVNVIYGDRYCDFYHLLGSLGPRAQQLGYPNFQVDTFLVRQCLSEDKQYAMVMLPAGEIYYTKRGEKSGADRTSAANTADYKIIEFAGASDHFDTLSDYIAAGYKNDHTGDDNIGVGPDSLVNDSILEIWRTLGVTPEGKQVQSITECDYLSSTPVLVEFDSGLEMWMPKVNTAKVFAGLSFKMRRRDPESDLARLMSTRLLSQWSDDLPLAKKLLDDFLKENPNMRRHPMLKSDYECICSYIGKFE